VRSCLKLQRLQVVRDEQATRKVRDALLGIELLVAVVVWILKLVFSKSKTSDDSVDSEV
jgi:hypothetical protein